MAGKSLKELRRDAESRLRDLNLTPRYTAEAFMEILAAHCGRPIVVHREVMPEELFGFVEPRLHDDHIFVNTRHSARIQQRTLYHEASHLLCGHISAPTHTAMAGEDIDISVITNLSPRFARRVLERRIFSTVQEQEAEVQAAIIRQRADGPQAERYFSRSEWLAMVQGGEKGGEHGRVGTDDGLAFP